MRKFKKSVWLPIILFIYATFMAVYFIPKNHETNTANALTIVGSYVVIILLWLSLRAQEKRREKEKEKENTDKEQNKAEKN